MGQSITDGVFEKEVLGGQSLALVDFWAEWCGPCKILGPTIDSIAREQTGKVRVYKMDVDANPETPSRFNIRGVPTVLFFKGGQLVDQLVGAHPKDAYLRVIAKRQSA